MGNNPNFYGYVFDSNIEIDLFGLNLSPERGYLRGKRHGLTLPNNVAQINANDEGVSHGKWGCKADLAVAGALADQLEPGGFHDFPVNPDSRSVL